MTILEILPGFLTGLISTYMLLVAISYILLFIIAVSKVSKEKSLNRVTYIEEMEGNDQIYPVSVIVPAYNEEVGIANTVRSLNALKYPSFEIIVVDDGSKDKTAEVMIEEFQMKQIFPASRKFIETGEVISVYVSEIFEHLTMICKENGGKADALNTGINASLYPYFCAIDGDSMLEADALLKVMKPIIESNGNIVITGGSVRIANGNRISRSKVEAIDLPKSPVVIMQIIEYFRGFLIGRIGLSNLNILLIISGAFGVFNKQTVIRAGGYNRKTMGEDMELIVRVHGKLQEENSHQKITYIPDPICWTEAPTSFRVLHKQRVRWQRGLTETLILHKRMLFNPNYKGIGMISLPYFLIVELFSGLMEAIGYLIIILGFIFNFIDTEIVLFMLGVTILYGSLISSLAILLEEWTFHKYPKMTHLLKLYFWSLTESFWYRPFLIVAKIQGLFQIFKEKKSWGDMERKGISSD